MMRWLFPVVSRWGARELEVRPDTLERDRPRVQAVFDGVAEPGSPTGARTCSASASRPPTSRSPRSPPRSCCRRSTARRCHSRTSSRSPSRATSLAFRAHPAGAFALRMFATERRAAAA